MLAKKNSLNHTDISSEFWVYRYLPSSWKPYLMSMRLDRPIGVWLLFLPCMWPLALFGDGVQITYFAGLFLLGSVLMRGAGCAYNDYVDFDIDQRVQRTKDRPLASGQISKKALLLFIFCLLIVSAMILIQLPWLAVALGVLSVIPVLIYPWMKRFTYWPQLFLGIAFNWGVLISWATVQPTLSGSTFVLYGVGFLWTLVYDTIYAHQDKEDDLKIGVGSTALKFADSTRPVLLSCLAAMLVGLGWLGYMTGLGWVFSAVVLCLVLSSAWQVSRLDYDNPADCLKAFKTQQYFGWGLMAAFLLDRLVNF